MSATPALSLSAPTKPSGWTCHQIACSTQSGSMALHSQPWLVDDPIWSSSQSNMRWAVRCARQWPAELYSSTLRDWLADVLPSE